jgi:hypothetical protein
MSKYQIVSAAGTPFKIVAISAAETPPFADAVEEALPDATDEEREAERLRIAALRVERHVTFTDAMGHEQTFVNPQTWEEIA